MQLLEAGETDYVERPKGFGKLVTLFMHDYSLSKQKAIELGEDCVMTVKVGQQPGQLIQFLQTQLEFNSIEAAKRLMDTVISLIN